MSVGFAGARGLADRRRRRLAQAAETPERRPPVRPSINPSAPAEFAASPIESIVRPQVWVTLLFVVFELGITGGAVYLGEWVVRNSPAALSSFGPDGLLLRLLPATYLLIAAQLAAAIHWYRARSRKDFHGRYRVWHFVVPSLLAIAFCRGTDAHLVFAGWAEARWRLAGEHAETLFWMVPTGTILLAMIRLLQTEMRGTGGAAPSLWIALAAAVTNAALVLKAPIRLDPEVLGIIGRSSAVLWPLGLLLALQLYARRVIYVSNEPSALPASRAGDAQQTARNWLNWWRPRQKSDRERPATAKRASDIDAKAAKSKSAAAPGAPIADADIDDLRTSATKPVQEEFTREAVPARPVPAAVAAPVMRAPMPASAATSPATKPMSASPAPLAESSDDEEDEDHEDMSGDRYRGLSKKERKKLRRLHERERRESLS